MNLYLFPCFPDSSSGYGIAVSSDIISLNCSPNDYFIFISDKKQENTLYKNSLVIYRRNPFFMLLNFFFKGHPSFFSSLYIYVLFYLKFRLYKFDLLFIGDINYFGIQNYFVFKDVKLRLHNVYLKIYNNLSKFDFSKEYLKFYYEVLIGCTLEKSVIRYSKNNKIDILCISEQERDFLINKFSLKASVLKIPFDCKISEGQINKFHWDNRIVWLGGLSSHKLLCMKYFEKNIYPELKGNIKNLRFELYGKGTEKFSMPDMDVFGYGFIDNFDFKSFSNSIFINPDLVGGGVKLKILSLVQNNVFFLTTHLGSEGFNKDELGSRVIIDDIENWKSILNSFKNII